MLTYAFSDLHQSGMEDIAVEKFDNIHDLFASILVNGINSQLKRGLHRAYLERQDVLPVMRGKINLPETIRNRIVHKNVLTCNYDELSENNLFNQILKTTVRLLFHHGDVSAKNKTELKKKATTARVKVYEIYGLKNQGERISYFLNSINS